MKSLIVIVGPTAVGKSSLSIEIAQRFSSPIINADSRQIYKEIPIGTAAPSSWDLEKVKHYFVGHLNIEDYYNASMYESDVLHLLDELFLSFDRIVLSGGSMMYIDAVCKGIDDIPTVSNKIREELLLRFKKDGLTPILEELKLKDPEHFLIVDKNNPRRVLHALEVCLSTNRTYSSFRKNSIKKRPFSICKIGLDLQRDELYKRIDERVDKMISLGLVSEAKKVYSKRNLNALNTVGYKELFEVFDGKSSLEQAIQKIKFNTHKYCRKQLTWFKRDKDITWFSPYDIKLIEEFIKENT